MHPRFTLAEGEAGNPLLDCAHLNITLAGQQTAQCVGEAQGRNPRDPAFVPAASSTHEGEREENKKEKQVRVCVFACVSASSSLRT
jgi:hypothetical protein